MTEDRCQKTDDSQRVQKLVNMYRLLYFQFYVSQDYRYDYP